MTHLSIFKIILQDSERKRRIDRFTAVKTEVGNPTDILSLRFIENFEKEIHSIESLNIWRHTKQQIMTPI